MNVPCESPTTSTTYVKLDILQCYIIHKKTCIDNHET